MIDKIDRNKVVYPLSESVFENLKYEVDLCHSGLPFFKVNPQYIFNAEDMYGTIETGMHETIDFGNIESTQYYEIIWRIADKNDSNPRHGIRLTVHHISVDEDDLDILRRKITYDKEEFLNAYNKYLEG